MASKRNPAADDAPAAPLAGMSQVDALKRLRIVIRAAQRHSSWVEKQCGVSGAQLWVMQELLEQPGLRVGELAEKLSIHQTTTSNLIDALVKKGLVSKARDQRDQRVVTLVLSERGMQLIRQAPTPARGLLPEALGKLDQHGLVELNRGLQALLGVIEQVDEAYGLQPLPFMM